MRKGIACVFLDDFVDVDVQENEMAIGDRLVATVGYQLQQGLPNGRNIDNAVNWYAAIGKELHALLMAAKQAGKLEVRITLMGIPVKVDIVLPATGQDGAAAA